MSNFPRFGNQHKGHLFSIAPQALIPRCSFRQTFQHKTTFNEGLLIPVFNDEVYPGDTISISPTFLCRLLTPVVPFMDNLYLDWFFFYVPLRLVWENFEKQQGAQENPGDSTDYLEPQINQIPDSGLPIMSIYDYMGVPTQVAFPSNTLNYTFTALYLRAYNLIWNEWFRDENLQDSVPFNKGDGPDSYNDYTLLRRGKRHDYFTSALPWPQKGPGVELPLGSTAPVYGVQGQPLVLQQDFNFTGSSGSNRMLSVASGSGGVVPSPSNLESTNVASWLSHGVNVVDSGTSNLFADLSEASAATINSLRQAFQVQKLYERDARGGTRYVEILRSHFGVISPDARLQRPEYLGGGSMLLNVNQVAQTSSTDSITPQGNLAAFSVSASNGRGGFRKSFVEHGILLCLVSVRADLTYQQGLDRKWQRHTRFDRYYPVFAHLGEQAILNSEILFKDDNDWNNGVFGYQERWSELRYKNNIITGKFRSTAKNSTGASDSLDVWHLSQLLPDDVALNSNFIEEYPPVDRVVAVQNEPHFYFDCYFRMNYVRPMPIYSVPGLVDHF